MRRQQKGKLANESNGVFSISVHDLTKYLLANETKPYVGIVEREIRECANGLAFLNRLVSEYMLVNRNTATYSNIGLTDAIGVLEYLMTGRAHPISNYLEGVRSSEFRKHLGLVERGNPEANKFEEIRRAIVVGAMLALMQKNNLKRDAAIRELIRITKASELTLTKSKIIGWQNVFEDKGNVGPQAFCNHILNLSENRQSTIEAIINYLIGNAQDVAFAT